MNNCLVTKLPGKVTDTSLLKVHLKSSAEWPRIFHICT